MRPLLALLLLAGPAPAQVDYPFHDGFETGVLEGHWSAGGDGATPARVTSDLSPASGAYHLQLGGLDEDGFVLCWFEVQVDLRNRQGVLLDFLMRRADYGVTQSEGLYLAPDGVGFQEAWQPDGLSTDLDTHRYVFDLDELAGDLQLEYTETFTIRYQWSGWDPTPTGGLFFDDFRVVAGGFSNLSTFGAVLPTGLGNFGASVAAVGDLDGDGVTELAVGHPGYSLKRGRVELFDGATFAGIGSVQKGIFGERMGESMAPVGDLDGDGYGELLVGAPSNDVPVTDAGAAYLVSPKLGTILHDFSGTQSGEAHGMSVASAGDLDGDGLDELLVGSPTHDGPGGEDAGRVVLYRGSDLTAWRTFRGVGEGERLGAALGAGADLDGDGVGDLVLGAPGWAAPGGGALGRAVAYSGATGELLGEYPGTTPGSLAGSALALLPDLDGDGVGELALGAPLDLGGLGTARILSGATGLELARFEGELTGDRLGSSLTMAGDVDGFGLEDLAIGADSVEVGAVVLVRLPELEVLRRASVVEPHTGFGGPVASLGDVNGDGFADLVCGEPIADDPASQDVGQVRVISTVTPPELDEVQGLHATLSGDVVLLGTDLSPGLEVLVDGLPVAFDALSPGEARIPLGPDVPGGFHDLTLVSDLGTFDLPDGLLRYPALDCDPELSLGGKLDVRLDNGSAGLFVLAWSPEAYATPAPFEAWGWYHGLELNGVWVAAQGVLTPGDTTRELTLTGPAEPFFLGKPFHLQAWTWQSDLDLVGFSNLATTTVVP